MENLVEEVLHWLMKTAEVLASSGYLAAKQYVITSAWVWLISGILAAALFAIPVILLLRWAHKEGELDEEYVWGLSISGVVIAGLILVLSVPRNLIILLSPDWYTIELLIRTISNK